MTETILNKVDNIQRSVKRAREVYYRNPGLFLDDYDAQDTVVLNILRACELSIDLANHIVKRDRLGLPKTSAESFELLARDERISHELSIKLGSIVGFRNVSVHEYKKIDYGIVVQIVKERLDDIISFTKKIIEAGVLAAGSQ